MTIPFSCGGLENARGDGQRPHDESGADRRTSDEEDENRTDQPPEHGGDVCACRTVIAGSEAHDPIDGAAIERASAEECADDSQHVRQALHGRHEDGLARLFVLCLIEQLGSPR